MSLNIKVCRRGFSSFQKLYLYIKIDGHVYYEELDIQIDKRDPERYKKQIAKAEDIRLMRLNELNSNPNLINEKRLSKCQPPDYMFIGNVSKTAGTRFAPVGLIQYINKTISKKLMAFCDFMQISNHIEEKFKFGYPGEYENYSTYVKVHTTPSSGYWPFMSIFIMRNTTSKVLEIMGFSCNGFIQPQSRELKEPDILIIPSERSRVSSKTYLMKDSLIGYTKIGKSIDVLKRERTLEAQNPNITLLAVCQEDVEKELHQKYKKYRKRGEWFKLNKGQIEEIIRDYGFAIQNTKP